MSEANVRAQKLKRLLTAQHLDLDPTKRTDLSRTQKIVRDSLNSLVVSQGGPFELSTETVRRLSKSVL